jgi:glutathione S-transferase
VEKVAVANGNELVDRSARATLRLVIGARLSLTLYYHPLASFCHKVLLALYENETPFEGRVVDLADEGSSAEMLSYWPVGKFPVIRDARREVTIPETSIIIEYLAQHYPGRRALIPSDPAQALEARLWDRFFDQYIHAPMQKVVTDRIRPAGASDPFGVDEAKATMARAYGVLEQRMERREFAAGDDFSIADCAAGPALFYAAIAHPFHETHPRSAAYLARLMARPSFVRVLDEARPYLVMFPLKDEIPAHLLAR